MRRVSVLQVWRMKSQKVLRKLQQAVRTNTGMQAFLHFIYTGTSLSPKQGMTNIRMKVEKQEKPTFQQHTNSTKIARKEEDFPSDLP